jgi:hypothetical protein
MHHQKSKTYSEERCYNYTDTNHTSGSEADLLYNLRHKKLCVHTTKFTPVGYCVTCLCLSDMCIMTYYCPHMVSFPQVSPPTPCMHHSSPPYMLHALPISFFLIWSPKLTFGEQYRAQNSSLYSHYTIRDVTLTFWTLALMNSDNLYLLFALRVAVSILHANGL